MKRIILVLIIVILVLIAGYKVYSKHLVVEYQKYCVDNCETTRVTRKELDRIKQSRSELAVSNIYDYQNEAEGIADSLSYDNLSNDEQQALDNIKLSEEYSESVDYSVDDLIELESDYKKADEEVKKVYHDYYERINKETIDEYIKQINDDKKQLEHATLSEDEQKQYDDLNEQLLDSNYDDSVDYNMDQLDGYIKEYRMLAKQYNYLAKYN